MKSRKLKFLLLVPAVLGLVAWSPPVGDNNVIVGSANTTPNSYYLGVFGYGNNVTANNSLVAGVSNNLGSEQSRSIISGYNNVLSGQHYDNLVTGYSNAVKANATLVSGALNSLDGPALNQGTSYSAAIGYFNQIATWNGYAVGCNNEVKGHYGVALGCSNIVSSSYGCALGGGLKVTEGGATAVGSWNAPMATGDVFVVGTGSPTTPATGLTVKYGGSVILGRAQGDISMGEYQ